MKFSWGAVGYRIMLVATFVPGFILTGSFFLLLALQPDSLLTTENITGLLVGIVLLGCFYCYFRDLRLHPLRWEPKIIELSHDISRHRVSTFFYLRAVQKNPPSDSRSVDYDVVIFDRKLRKAIPLDRNNNDHDRLYRSFLDHIQSYGKSPAPLPYSRRWKILRNPDRG